MAFLAIGKTKVLSRFEMGPYTCVLHGDVESIGLIEFGHVLEVLDPATGRRVYAVASERNQLASSLGGSSHFLCAYDGGTHLNYGSSNDWADREKFLSRARELVREKLGVGESKGSGSQPQQLQEPPPWLLAEDGPRQWARLPGMILSLLGALLYLASRFATLLDVYAPGVNFSVGLMGLLLFSAGCAWTALGIPRPMRWAPRFASALGLAGAAMYVAWIWLRDSLFMVPPQGLLMAAIFFHGAFQLALFDSMGKTYSLGPGSRLLFAWLLFTGLYIYANWIGGGYTAPWVTLVGLGGIAVWAAVQALLIATGRSRGG
jgi:hypothetical protein